MRPLFSWRSPFDHQPLIAPVPVWALGCIMMLLMSLLGWLSQIHQQIWLMSSFATSVFLLFYMPYLPVSRPWSLCVAHLLTVGLAWSFQEWFGSHYLLMALSIACCVWLMLWLDCMHPPALSNPVMVFYTSFTGWELLWTVAVGVSGLWLLACGLGYFQRYRRARS